MKNIGVSKIITVLALGTTITMGGLWAAQSSKQQKEFANIETSNKNLLELESKLEKELSDAKKLNEDLKKKNEEIEKTKNSEIAKLKETSTSSENANLVANNEPIENQPVQETEQPVTDSGLDAAAQANASEESVETEADKNDPEYAVFSEISLLRFVSSHGLSVDDLMALNDIHEMDGFKRGSSYRVK